MKKSAFTSQADGEFDSEQQASLFRVIREHSELKTTNPTLHKKSRDDVPQTFQDFFRTQI